MLLVLGASGYGVASNKPKYLILNMSVESEPAVSGSYHAKQFHGYDKVSIPKNCHGNGCIIASLVRHDRVRFGGCKSALDYKISVGKQKTPRSYYTYDSGYVAYHPVSRSVFAGLRLVAERVSGLTVTCFEQGHNYHTASGNLSAHSFGKSVDIGWLRNPKSHKWVQISAANQCRKYWGDPAVSGRHRGCKVDSPFTWVLKKGIQACKDAGARQVISLIDTDGPTGNSGSFMLPDHYNHIHCGW